MTHPALETAIAACQTLAEAAKQLGAGDPIEAVEHLDCDPAAITDYAGKLKTTLAELDKAIDQQLDAIAELEADSGGEGTESAIEEAKKELAELQQDRTELDKLAMQIAEIGEQLEKLVVHTAAQISQLAGQATPAATDVLDGSSWIDLSEAENTVITTVAEIIRLAGAFQQQVDGLREQFAALIQDEASAAAGTGAAGQQGPQSGGGTESGQQTPDSSGPSTGDAPD
ncbi:hypothetical protein [Amycolatopsis magusensis]|uniref:DNA repair exonuclease SbcCD ATPase subunit n=1 Tax=Amycolatopsis magusensis TaxID=882444 RepID=A0ABS4PN14_9PSEU|nr:hypothetical protein [Amycolatopsis magusensis]MBP2180249.1 DNA repair exonuclease SbcCD ATPase subunit [Amycolatopsis magusensis]